MNLFIIAFISTTSDAQNHNIFIAGKVADDNTRLPLPGATVHIKETTHEVITDNDGGFTFLTGQRLPVTLQISYIGYESREVQITKPGPVTVWLPQSNSQLLETTVVGYTQTKRNARTGAVTTVSAADFSKVSYTSIIEKLQGKVPGLLVSNNSGVPGTSVLVRLRGATSITAGNEPLYVVDGVFINNESLQALSRGLGGQVPNPLSDLNPDDIESVSVLKDANATAVYGARGANGVILITTKRGARNSKTKVNVNAEAGLAKATNLWQLVSGKEHAELVNLVHQNDGKSFETRPFRPVTEVITGWPAYGTPDEQQTYDRIHDVFRTAQLQKYNLSIAGGDAKTNFYIGGEYQKSESTLKLEDLKRYAFRINLDHSVLKNLKIGTSNSISSVPRREVRVGDGPAGLFQAALHTPTFYPFFNKDGTYYKPTVFDNHLAILNNSDTWSYSLRSINSLYATLTILQGLSFKSSISNDYSNYHEKAYYNTNLVYGQPAGEANDVTSTRQTLIAEQLLNFNRSFNRKNDLSLFLGNTVQYSTTERQTLTGTGFPSNQMKRIASAAVQTASSSGSQYRLVSFFSGVNYSYNNKYSIDANLRADASSRFGKKHRWGYFPSAGAAWNIARESFFPKSGTVNELKLKASYGLTGNQNIGDFAARGLWGGGQNYLQQPGIAPNQLANPDLKWETTRQWNVGLSGSLLNKRLSIELDYYHKYTYDLLLNQPVPVISGLSSVVSNIGAMSNTGIELLLTSINVEQQYFSWNTSFTLSHNRNRVEKLVTPIADGSYGMYRLEQGFPMYSIWVYNQLGVDPQTGSVIVEDKVHDGKITTDDKKIVGDIWPKFEGALKNTLIYKGLDLNINIFYKSGNKVFNYTRMFLEAPGTRGVTRSIQRSALNYWKKPGDVNVLPKPTTIPNADGSLNYEGQSSRFLEDASFIRLRDVTLVYTLPRSLASRVGISNIRIYATASNLLTITKYSGPDPEANVAGDTDGLVQGLDFNSVPQPVTVVFGINLTL